MRKTCSFGDFRKSVFLGLLVLLLFPLGASADNIDYLLDEGRVLLEEDVDFNGALAVFLSVAENEHATEDQRFEGQRQAAFCLVALDRMEKAHELMVEMLISRPGYELPAYTSPKMLEAMDAARVEAEQLREEERKEMMGSVREPPADVSTSWARASTPRASQRHSLLPYYAAAGGGALVALGVGSVNGLAAKRAEDRLLNDKDSFYSHDEALEFRDNAAAQARRANWLFATSAILAVTAGTVLYLDRTPDTGLAMTESGGLLVVTTRSWD